MLEAASFVMQPLLKTSILALEKDGFSKKPCNIRDASV
jgi:hypothetical protein